jgi:hypothetical protein
MDNGVNKVSGPLRGWFFTLAFIAIGLTTNFRELKGYLKGGKPIILKFCLDELVRMHGPAGVLTAKAFISNATIHEEVMPGIPDRDLEGRLLLKAAVRRTLTLEFALLDFIEEQDEMP